MNELFKPFLLEGQVALVTGASSGFGRHFGTVLAAAGARVVLAARRTDRVQEACEAIIAAGGEAVAVTMDVTDSASIAAAFDAAEQAFGLVTVVVNNAGITIPKPLVKLTDSDWSEVIDTNLNGVAYVTREAAQRMIAADTGGSVVNIASILAQREQKMLTNYAASKAAIDIFTKGLSDEVAAQNIRVNAIRPGLIETGLHAKGGEPGRAERLAHMVPMKRTGSAEEVAKAILFLMSDAASYVTGTTLDVTGGR